MRGHRPIRITPRDARLLVRYLDGVEDAVCARLSSGFKPREDHLTSLLCEMLDEKMSQLHTLPYPVTELRKDLAVDHRQLRVSFAIEAKEYPRLPDPRTSADLGLVVVYRDHLQPENSFERGALFEAKRLYRSRYGDKYSLYDTFNELRTDQLLRLAKLEADESIKKEEADDNLPWDGRFCFYLFYCPRLEAYEEQRATIFPIRDPWINNVGLIPSITGFTGGPILWAWDL